MLASYFISHELQKLKSEMPHACAAPGIKVFPAILKFDEQKDDQNPCSGNSTK